MRANQPGHLDVDLAIRAQRHPGRFEERQPDVEIARLATRRGGVVARHELLALGLSHAAIGRRVKAGRLHLIHRGVYAVGHEALTWHARGHAALLAVGGEAALSHASGAIAYRMRRNEGEPFEVTTRGRRPRSRPGLVIHSSCVLDVRIFDGLAVTTPARTLLDLAAREDISRTLAEAKVARLVTDAELRRELQRNPNHHGSANLARSIDTTEPTRSELERRFADLLRRAVLPMPRFNARLGRYEVDALWERERLVVEIDGWAAHGHRAAFERDRARDAELQARGYVVLPFTWRQVVDEALLVATRIAQVLARR